MTDIKELKSIERNQYINKLVALWQKSVATTHDFLDQKAIADLKPEVEEGLLHIENLFVSIASDGSIKGFTGTQGDKIEMLFVDPQRFGKGIGRSLLTWATEHLDARYVDVNEQNPGAAEFYRHMGFEVFDRSPTDDVGRPYPILHLKLK